MMNIYIYKKNTQYSTNLNIFLMILFFLKITFLVIILYIYIPCTYAPIINNNKINYK